MNKYVVIALFMCLFSLLTNAQEKNAFEQELMNKMALLKNKDLGRKIEFKKKMFSDTRTAKEINPIEMSEDSLLHFLVGHGFYDFNFKFFQINIRELNDLNKLDLKTSHPKIYDLLSDSMYNKITYCYKKTMNGLRINAIISKNLIEIDSIKTLNAKIGCGYYQEDITFKGRSTIKNIECIKDNSFTNIISMRNHNQSREIVNIGEDSEFSVTVDVSDHSDKYVLFTDESDNILSIIKIYSQRKEQK